jgi:RNA polymerase sigma-70 factor (ECF subfamily)
MVGGLRQQHVTPGFKSNEDRETASSAIARAASGEAQACRELVERYGQRVAAQIRGMLVAVGRTQIVEDLTQDAFLRAFRALPSFVGGEREFKAWILTIATRVALNELRRRPPAVELFDTVTDSLAALRQEEGESRLIGRAIERALADLAPSFRAAFLLRELHGMSYAEIASMLQIEVGTAKSRVSRGRLRLRELLNRGEP